MIKSRFQSLFRVLVLLGSSVPLLSGCANTSHGESVEETGSISVALTASGGSGIVYGFPLGTYLQVASPTIYEYVPLSGPEPQVQQTFPVGAYTASLYFQNGNVELTKTDGTVTSTVGADWTNPQPVTFDIVQGQTTPLALQFSVGSLNDVVFETGTLQVSADVVEEGTNAAASASFDGTTNFSSTTYFDSTSAYASALAVDQGVDYGLSLGFELGGDWVQSGSHSVCQPGTLTQASSSGSDGLSRRIEQLVGGTGQLCVYDNGSSDVITLYPARFGAPPAGQEMFLPDPSYAFYAGVIAYVGDIYDGTTLRQTQMENASLPNAYFYHQLYDATQELSFAQGTFNATLQLSP